MELGLGLVEDVQDGEDSEAEEAEGTEGGEEQGKGSKRKKSSSTVCAITLKQSSGSEGGGNSRKEALVMRFWNVFPVSSPSSSPVPETTRNIPGYLTGKYSPSK